MCRSNQLRESRLVLRSWRNRPPVARNDASRSHHGKPCEPLSGPDSPGPCQRDTLSRPRGSGRPPGLGAFRVVRSVRVHGRMTEAAKHVLSAEVRVSVFLPAWPGASLPRGMHRAPLRDVKHWRVAESPSSVVVHHGTYAPLSDCLSASGVGGIHVQSVGLGRRMGGPCWNSSVAT